MIQLEHALQPEEQLCFIHIPKTAGTTLISLLDAHFSMDCICPAQLWRDLAWLPKDQVSQYQLLRGHYTYEDYLSLVPNPVFISMFRNPIDRACSYYNFMRNQPDDWLKRHDGYRRALVERHPQVAALVEADIEIYQRANRDELSTFFASSFVQTWIQNWQVKAIARSSFDSSPWDPEAVLERAQKRLSTLAWFGLVERFADSIALLSYTFGWTPMRRYQQLMVAPNPDYTEGLSAKTVEILHEIHQLDLALYRYAVDHFEQRYEAMQEDLDQRYSASVVEPDLYELLEQHYCDRVQALSPQRQTVIDLTFDQAIAGTGWHLREGGMNGQTWFRWTGPETESTLDLPLAPGQDFTLKLRIVGAISEAILEGLRVSVGDYSISLVRLCHEARPNFYLVLLEGVIPAEAIDASGLTRLTFSVQDTRSLHSLDPSNPDRRPVGVAMDWIRLFPEAALGDDGYRYMLFPGHDAAWIDVARWLRSRLDAVRTVIAPFEFLEVLPEQALSYEAAANQQNSDTDWMIVHKGMLDALPLALIDKVVTSWTPVYADAVFVVFTKRSDARAIASNHPDLKSFQTAYVTLFNSRPPADASQTSDVTTGSYGEDYRSLLFPAEDPTWDAAARWLRSHQGFIHQIIAPSEFAEVLPNQVLSYETPTQQSHYNADWVVIHKGMLNALPLSFLNTVQQGWNPVYANAVFVVFTTRSNVEAIAAENSDLQAFQEAFQRLIDPGAALM